VLRARRMGDIPSSELLLSGTPTSAVGTAPVSDIELGVLPPDAGFDLVEVTLVNRMPLCFPAPSSPDESDEEIAPLASAAILSAAVPTSLLVPHAVEAKSSTVPPLLPEALAAGEGAGHHSSQWRCKMSYQS
jgi:hypothetical protein